METSYTRVKGQYAPRAKDKERCVLHGLKDGAKPKGSCGNREDCGGKEGVEDERKKIRRKTKAGTLTLAGGGNKLLR